jgi:hypothetical protein
MVATQDAIKESIPFDSQEIKHRMEQAQLDVLCDETWLDADLSDKGRREARMAAQTLWNLQRQHLLLISTPPITKVLVSPLTRTLETANLIFPKHNIIHVREELRERCTGKPPDTQLSSATLRRRKSFKRFSMDDCAQILSLASWIWMPYYHQHHHLPMLVFAHRVLVANMMTLVQPKKTRPCCDNEPPNCWSYSWNRKNKE